MASNTLTNIIPTIYAAMDVVSREITGAIQAVSKDFSAEQAAKDETIRSPVVPQGSLESISPGQLPADSGGQTISYVDMTLSKAYAYPIWWTGEDEKGVRNTGQFDRVMQQRIEQGLRTFANTIESDVASVYSGFSRAYGTAGTTPFGSDFTALAELGKILTDNGAPKGDRHCIIDTAAGTNLRSLTNLTNVNQAGTDQVQRTGELISLSGFMLRESAGIQTQDNSSEDDSGTTTVSGAHSKGATTITIGAASADSTFVPGNFITIGDHKYMMVMDSNVTVSSGGTGDVTIAEPGLMADVADGTSVTQNTDNFVSNMAFARNAIQLATRPPARPSNGDLASDVTMVTDPVSGLTFQVAMYPGYYGVKYEIALCWGWKLVKPEHAAVLLG